MSSLKEAYRAIALEVQAKLSSEYLAKLNLEIAENLCKESLRLNEEYQAEAS